ncbi:hypothetical protein O9H85_22470 [Paenibacillus filicis]|uniref:Uncharacterized protein n=1 Tax=Paenibacillus gyeongsangnamensis TaxID=3388067 RepID=A0ABT4QE35_9BACL|nr:hypothetical protein [Paenibacillus filicis]MCZ8515133.1 hypothetical protein [Paenibacillus filicis]
MKWGAVLGATVILFLMALYEWPKMNQEPKKEKAVFVSLAAMGWILAVLLIFFPDMPGPTQLIDKIYKPLGRLIEK